MKKRMVQFPRMAATYMRHTGMEIQMLIDSIPGIPNKQNAEISNSEVLRIDIPVCMGTKMKVSEEASCSGTNRLSSMSDSKLLASLRSCQTK
jgi:hypothetical protein